MTNIESLIYYLNINIERDKRQRILYFNQTIYLKKFFKDYNMWDCNFVVTFMKSNVKLMIVDLDYVVFVKNKHIYQFAINFLIYVMLDIRLDMIYVVSIINRYVFNFNKFHWVAMKRIFRYLRNTLNFRLIFVEKFTSLIDYIDVD